MKDAVELILLTTFVLALIFIFEGTPDIWDVWHNSAMIGTKCQ